MKTNFKNKNELIKFLHYIRKTHVCSYLGFTCDCKYGIVDRLNDETLENICHPKDLKQKHYSGEQTGCPELWDLIEVFENMTEKDFKQLFLIS